MKRDRSETVLAYIAANGPIEARDIAAGLGMELRPVKCALSRMLNKSKQIRVAGSREVEADAGASVTTFAYAIADGALIKKPEPVRIPIQTYDALAALRAMQEAAHRHQQFQAQ